MAVRASRITRFWICFLVTGLHLQTTEGRPSSRRDDLGRSDLAMASLGHDIQVCGCCDSWGHHGADRVLKLASAEF